MKGTQLLWTPETAMQLTLMVLGVVDLHDLTADVGLQSLRERELKQKDTSA